MMHKTLPVVRVTVLPLLIQVVMSERNSAQLGHTIRKLEARVHAYSVEVAELRQQEAANEPPEGADYPPDEDEGEEEEG